MSSSNILVSPLRIFGSIREFLAYLLVTKILMIMVHADLGQVIFWLLTLGGIAVWMKCHWFGGKIPVSKRETEKAMASEEVYDAKKDYFSRLPDDILSSILAHLTVRDAVRTSILSRRWRYLFATMPTLNLSLDMFGIASYNHSCCSYYQRKFLKVINKLLQLYSGRKVSRVEIKFCIGREFSSEYDQIMHSVSVLGVERLCLYFDCGTICLKDDYNPDPSKLFKFSLELLSQASSLEYLLLDVCIIQPSIGVRLNSLRTLILTGVLLARGQLEGILSSCLNLNLLHLYHCRLPNKLHISSSVTTVIFRGCGGLEEIDFQATNLHTFQCSLNCDKLKFYFSCVPMLELVTICLTGNTSMRYIFGDFARELPEQVKHLTVKASCLQVRCFPSEPQIFRNLRSLTLLLHMTYDFDIVKISPLLGACPLLQYLDIVQGTRMEHARESKRCPLSPTYHTELKQVRFGGFHGSGEEIEFVIYILKSALVLERMFLSPYLIGPYYEPQTRWDAWEKIWGPTRNSIQQELYGQAISANAVVIIK